MQTQMDGGSVMDKFTASNNALVMTQIRVESFSDSGEVRVSILTHDEVEALRQFFASESS